MYDPNQNGNSHRSNYPYEPRTHTYASPAGMHYPAPTTHPIPLRPAMNGDYYPQDETYVGYGSARNGRREDRYDHQSQPYGPGDWAPHPNPHPRVGLGISTTGHPELVPPQLAPHTSYHLGRPNQFELPPVPNRSITLDSTSNAGGRAYQHSSYSQNPAHYQSSGTRTASPLSSRSSQPQHDQHSGRKGKPWPKPRIGGPPKAPLGGIGGKPWDERINDRSVSSPLPTRGPGTPLRPASMVTEEEIPTFKGSPIIFKPPPSIYIPHETPEIPASHLDSEGGERTPRKDAYPWPVQPPDGPPDTIPLPPSPIDPDPERGGRRTWTSFDSTTTMDPSDGMRIKGKAKEIEVALPNEVSHLSSMSL